MQPNPHSKTVKGLSIAIIVLSALGLLFCLGVGLFSGVVGTAVDQNSEEIAEDLNKYIDSSEFSEASAQVDITTEDKEELDAALKTLEGFQDVDTSKLVELIGYVKSDDAASIVKMFTSDDGSFKELVQSYEKLSDEELTELANSMSDTSANELIEFREMLVQLDESGITDATTADGVKAANTLFMGFSMTMVIVGFLLCLITLIAGILAVRNAEKPEKLGGAFVMSIISAVAAFLCGRIVTLVLLIVNCVQISKVRKGQI